MRKLRSLSAAGSKELSVGTPDAARPPAGPQGTSEALGAAPAVATEEMAAAAQELKALLT